MKPNDTTDALVTEIDVAITFADRTAGGVKVRELPVKLFKPALDSLGDELRFVELVTANPPGWAETLSPRSLTDVAEAAQKVNQGFFAYVARRVAQMQALAPGAFAAMAQPRG
jgi:hypothetical protein